MEIALRYGESGDYERSGISLRLAPLWSADWGAGRLRFELNAGSEEPNDGVDLHQLVVGAHL